jgi:hypothetical protein
LLRVDLRLGDGGLALILLELLATDEAFTEQRCRSARVALGQGQVRLALLRGSIWSRGDPSFTLWPGLTKIDVTTPLTCG